MRSHTAAPRCDEIFDEDEDRWRVTSTCTDPTCASSSTYSAAQEAARAREANR